MSSSQRRPPTPTSAVPAFQPSSSSSGSQPVNPHSIPPVPKVPTSRNSTSHPPRRSSLGFLRRTKSGDPVRKMPVVPPQPPKLPDLWVNGSSSSSGFPRHLLNKDIRDSVDILSGRLTGPSSTEANARKPAATGGYAFVPGRRSTDSVIGDQGQYVKSSSVPLTQDPYAGIGSITNRGRYSYASSAVSTVHTPRRVRRRKDPTPFNVLVIGARNSGKTSFLRFLRHSLALKPRRGQAVDPGDELLDPSNTDPTNSGTPFKSSYLETDIDGERVGLTLWDSVGLEKNVVDLQLRETLAFIESKFEDTFSEETKVVRAPGITDTHIHCVFLLLDPARLTPSNSFYSKSKGASGGLDPDLDIAVLRALQGKTVVVPVISKADTLTEKQMLELKDVVRNAMKRADIDPLEVMDLGFDETNESTPTVAPRGKRGSLQEVDEPSSGEASSEVSDVEEEDEEASEANADNRDRISVSSSAKETASLEPVEEQPTNQTPPLDPTSASLTFIPLSIISPDSYEPGKPVGRKFPWGFANPYDEQHCDFVMLKESIFSEWRAELREKSRDIWYENWRSDRLGLLGHKVGRPSRRR